MIYSKNDILEKKCYSCKKIDHFITSCPILTLKINKEKVINAFIETSDYQKRITYERKNRKTQIKKNHSTLIKANQKFLYENDDLCFIPI